MKPQDDKEAGEHTGGHLLVANSEFLANVRTLRLGSESGLSLASVDLVHVKPEEFSLI